MDASKKQREPVAFKSLAELKRFIRPGVEFKTVSHANHADMVGLTRVVTTVQTVGFYSKIKDQPEHPFSTCNHGKGFYTDFGKAGNYIFDGTTVKVKDARKQDRGVIYELEFYDRKQNMEETMMDRKMVNFLREQYPPGTRIRLNAMDDPHHPILPGTEGEVDFVDDEGQIFMKWDNGRTLPLIPGEDSFTVLPPKLTTLKLYMPLTADLYERNEYGDLDDSSTLLEGRELRGYQDQITAALVKNRMPEETERGLMHCYAKLELPASPWEVWDAMEKVRLQTDDILYMEVEDYYAFEYLSPHLDGLDISLNELNDLAAQLAALDEVQGIAFEGMFSIAVQRKVNANGGVITLQDLRDLAVSAKTDCYHVVDAADDAALGRFYAENDFIPKLDGVSDAVFKMLDFAGIGRMMRHSENGVFVGSLYVLQDGELTTAPPVQKTLPEKPGYLFRLTLGLHPDIGDDRTVTLDLPAAEAELLDAQEQLGTEGWEGVTVIDYDGIIPYAAEFTDLPMELEELNAFTKTARDIPRSEVPKLKALLEQFEVQDIETAMLLTEHLADYILTPGISSPQEAALDQLCFIMDREEAVRLIPYVNLFNYGETVIHADNAALTSYGLLHRADYEPMLSPMQQKQEKEMTMQ